MDENTIFAHKKIIEDTHDDTVSYDINMARKRIAYRLLDLQILKHNNNNNIYNDADLIDADALACGIIVGTNLNITVPLFSLSIDLKSVIHNSLREKILSFIHLLLDKKIDIFAIEPTIMTIVVANLSTDADTELFVRMINNKIPIHTDNYKCIFLLAHKGNLDLIKLILETYTIPNIIDVVGFICCQAIIQNHLPILEHFFTPDAFIGAPDQLFIYFINSIKHGSNLSIIKFFVNNGINIKQQNYAVVREAIIKNRIDIVQYFYTVDPEIINLLDNTQKNLFGLL